MQPPAMVGVIPIFRQQTSVTNQFTFKMGAGLENGHLGGDFWIVFDNATAFLHSRRFYRVWLQ